MFGRYPNTIAQTVLTTERTVKNCSMLPPPLHLFPLPQTRRVGRVNAIRHKLLLCRHKKRPPFCTVNHTPHGYTRYARACGVFLTSRPRCFTLPNSAANGGDIQDFRLRRKNNASSVRLCGVPCCGNLDKVPPSYPMKAQCTDCLYSPSSNRFCGVQSSQQLDCRAWNIVRKDNPSIARSLRDTRATRPNYRTVQPTPSRLPPPFWQ